MICVVGALAVDMLVRRDRFVRGTSNPAAIVLEPGGGGYRIFSGLPGPKRLYTALGADHFGRWLAEQIADGQQLQPIFLERYRTACYCAFMESGKLLYGAADMAVGSRLQEFSQGSFRALHVLGNRVLTGIVNWVFENELSDMMSGYRAISRELQDGSKIVKEARVPGRPGGRGEFRRD